MFKEADKNGDGSLDASELRSFAAFSLPECVNDELFYEAFDKNGDKKLDAEEVYNMMTYFEMKKRLSSLYEGRAALAQCSVARGGRRA